MKRRAKYNPNDYWSKTPAMARAQHERRKLIEEALKLKPKKKAKK